MDNRQKLWYRSWRCSVCLSTLVCFSVIWVFSQFGLICPKKAYWFGEKESQLCHFCYGESTIPRPLDKPPLYPAAVGMWRIGKHSHAGSIKAPCSLLLVVSWLSHIEVNTSEIHTLPAPQAKQKSLEDRTLLLCLSPGWKKTSSSV